MASQSNGNLLAERVIRELPASWVLSLFLLLVLLAFGRALWNDYAYDSTLLIGRLAEENASASILFDTEAYGTRSGVMSYRPLTTLTHILYDLKLAGASPFWSHLLNLLIHAANGWLLFLLLARLLNGEKARTAALFASAVFLVHPLVSEAVLCAGFRFDLLALFFSLLALLMAESLSVNTTGGPLRIAIYASAMGLFFFLGLLAKEIAVIVLPLAPILIWKTDGGLAKPALSGVLLLLLFAGFYLIWKQFRFADYPTVFWGEEGRLFGMANFLASSVEVYLWKLAWPWPLRVDYAFEPLAGWGHPRLYKSLGVLLLLGGGVAWLSLREWVVAFGALWVLLAFAPVSQIVAIPDPVAERFAYVPMAGAAIILAGGLARLFSARRETAGPIAALFICVLLVYTGLSHWRSWNWRNDVALNIANWEQADDQRPVARRSLGALYIERAKEQFSSGRPGRASQSLLRAGRNLRELLEIRREDSEGWRLLAVVHLASGDKEEARKAARRALELAPDDPMVANLAGRLNVTAQGAP